jgi:hypothetical protein
MADINVILTQPDIVNVTMDDAGDINVSLTTPEPIAVTLSQSQGEHGKSAFEEWLALGNIGDESVFIASLKGAKGDTGSQGERGLQGVQGIQGERGLQGVQGEQGVSTNSYRDFTFVLHLGENAVTGIKVTNDLIVSSSMTILKCYAYAMTAPIGSDFICDINKNGTSIWTNQANRIKIVDGESSGIQTNFDITSLSENDLLTIDINQVGSSVAGSGITILLKCLIS